MADEGLIDRLRAAFAPQDTQSYAYDPTGYSAPSATPSFLNKYMPAGMFAGDPEAQASANASQAMSPVVSPYLAKVLSGAMSGDSLKEGLQSVNDAFANHDYPALAGMFAGGGAGIKAYHASPFDFNAFDLSKVGTGQGAQSFGHGIYAAESPAVSGPKGQYDMEFTAKNLGKPDLNQGEANVLRMLRDNGTDMDVIGHLAQNGYSFDDAIKTLNAVKQAKAKIYEVNIDADPEQFLHWDKPLSEQPHVQEAFDKLGATPGPRWELLPDAQLATGADRLSPEQESAALLKHGIPGIRYLDQGSRNAGGWHITPPGSTVSGKWMVKSSDYNSKGLHFDTEAEAQRALQDKIGGQTSNYVVFDPRIVQILKKYGLAGVLPSAGLAAGTGNDQ